MLIIFVCTGNTCRSPMAEGLFKRILQEKAVDWDDIQVLSAGTAIIAGDTVADNAKQALAEVGVDLGDKMAQMLTAELVEKADLILTMTRSHKERVLSLLPKAEDKTFCLWEYVGDGEDFIDVADPFMQGIDVYRLCRDEIEEALSLLPDKLAESFYTE